MRVKSIRYYPSGWAFFAVDVDAKDFETFVAAARAKLKSTTKKVVLKKHVVDADENYVMYEIGRLSFDYLKNQGYISAVLDGEELSNKDFFNDLVRKMEIIENSTSDCF